jgi:hypothetical protein
MFCRSTGIVACVLSDLLGIDHLGLCAAKIYAEQTVQSETEHARMLALLIIIRLAFLIE